MAFDKKAYRKKYYQEHKEQGKEYNKKYNKLNREKINQQSKALRNKNPEASYQLHLDWKKRNPNYVALRWAKVKEKFFEMYGNSCRCCGEVIIEFLTLEHKFGQVGKKKDTSYKAYCDATKEYNPEKYEVLCMNCNHAKGRFGNCPHEKIKS